MSAPRDAQRRMAIGRGDVSLYAEVWAREANEITQSFYEWEQETHGDIVDCLFDWHYQPDIRGEEFPVWKLDSFYRHWTGAADRGDKQGICLIEPYDAGEGGGWLGHYISSPGGEFNYSPYDIPTSTDTVNPIPFQKIKTGQDIEYTGTTPSLRFWICLRITDSYDPSNDNMIRIAMCEDTTPPIYYYGQESSPGTDLNNYFNTSEINSDGFSEYKWVPIDIEMEDVYPSAGKLSVGDTFYMVPTLSGGTSGRVQALQVDGAYGHDPPENLTERTGAFGSYAWTYGEYSLCFLFSFDDSATFVKEIATPVGGQNDYPYFYLDHDPFEGTLTYQIEGSNDSFVTSTVLDGVEDGDLLPHIFDDWKITVTLNSDGEETTIGSNDVSINHCSSPGIYAIGLSWPDKKYCFSGKGFPSSQKETQGIYPLIKNVSELGGKMEFEKVKTQAKQVTLNLINNSKNVTESLIYEQHDDYVDGRTYWKGMLVYIFLCFGYDQLGSMNMYQLFKGRVKDFKYGDHGSCSFVISDYMTDINKYKIPSTKVEDNAGTTTYNISLPEDSSRDNDDFVGAIEYLRKGWGEVIRDLLLNLKGQNNRIDKFTKRGVLNIDMQSIVTVDVILKAIDSDFGRAFSRAKPFVMATATGYTVSGRTLALTGYSQEWGTEADNWCRGLAARLQNGNIYKIGKFTAATDSIIVSSELYGDDATTPNSQNVDIITWDTRIKNQESIIKNIMELCLLGRVMCVMRDDGRLKFIKYTDDPIGDSVITDSWYDDDIMPGVSCWVETDNHQLINECNVWYGNDGHGDNFENFTQGSNSQHNPSMNKWGERANFDIFSKWLHMPQATFYGKDIANYASEGWVNQGHDGIMHLRHKTHIGKYWCQKGDYLSVYLSRGWIKPEERPDKDINKEFVIIDKKLSGNNTTISWELMEVT